MDSPLIALRFRDSVPGIDTIEEHRAILTREGRVAWGWWKKAHEEAQAGKIRAALKTGDDTPIALVDRTLGRTFLCICNGFIDPQDADLALVPEYYRSHVEEIAGLFLLSSIEEVEHRHLIADALGERTFIWLQDARNAGADHVAATADAIGRSCVLHLSDLLFGADYGFRLQGEDVKLGDPRRTLTECLVADLRRLKLDEDIAAVVVTGDFMTRGEWNGAPRRDALAEFEALRLALRLEREQIIAVPGNHDVVRYPEGVVVDVRENAVEKQARYDHENGFRLFVDELVGRGWRESLNYVRRIRLGAVDLDLCVLNSCTIAATSWTEYGYVGRNGLDAIAELVTQPVERPTFRFLALHHHLLPVAAVETLQSKGVTLTLDSADILAAAQRAGVHVALHGHQHKPKLAVYRNLPLNGEQDGGPVHVVANGSAGAKHDRLPPGERNTYCLFRLSAEGVDAWIRELRLDGVAGADVFTGTLEAKPLTP